MNGANTSAAVKKLYSIQEAAVVLNVHAWKVRRAIKRDVIPSYTFLNIRRLVRISDIEAALVAGGQP